MHIKHEFRLALEKAKTGGTKAKKGAVAEKKSLSNCILFVGKEFPSYKRKVIEVLAAFTFDSNGVIQGDYVSAIRAAIPDKKEAGMAMKVCAAKIAEAKELGKDKALNCTIPFDEVTMLNEPQVHRFIFNDVPAFDSLKVVLSTEECDPVAKNSRDGAEPGKPAAYYF